MQQQAMVLLAVLLLFGCTGQPETPGPTPAPTAPPAVQPFLEPAATTSPEPTTQIPPPPAEPLPGEHGPPPIESAPAEDPFSSFEGVQPGVGIGTTLPGGSTDNGPWKHRIKSASSSDGLRWTRDNEILADQASVPDAIIDAEANIRVYYVDWKNQGVTVAINKNDGWRYYRVKIKSQEFFEGADPDVVLAEGTYRMYFTKFGSPGSRMASIRWVVSGNGVEFENETTAYPREEGVTDPDVFQTSEEWIMYLSNGPQNILTTSDDGLQFRKENEPSLSGSVSNTIAVPGGYRMYYHKSNAQGEASIYSRFSRDGRDWEEEGIRLAPTSSEESVESPAVVQLPDGSYKMFYHSMIND